MLMVDLDRIEGEFLEAFIRDGGVEPVCVIFAGSRMIDSIPVMNDRAAFTDFVRRICRETSADTVVVYAEAWGAKDSPDSLRPSMRRDRQELLMTYTETAESATVRGWPIIRIAGGALAGLRVLLGDMFTMDTKAGGGFDNLLGR